jgi:hypothetical protein
MYNDLPDEIIEAIGYEVGHNDLDYDDNYRAYRHKDDKFREDYEMSLDAGCCGFFDVHYTDLSGDVWTIGCNYGH